MRSWLGRRTFSTSAAVVTGLLALASVTPASAQQPKPAPTAKPAAAPAKPADKPAAGATGGDKAAGGDAKAAAPAAGDKAGAKPADKTAAKPADKPAKPLTEKQKKDRAPKAYKEAEAKFEKQDYAGALELYREADTLVPGARPKFKIATTLDKLGNVTEAVGAYQAFLDSKPDPEKLKDLIAEANTRMEALKKTPAKVKVVTAGPETPAAVKLTVDGVEQPAGAGNELALAPGKHKIEAKAEGFDPATQEVEVTYAETKEVSLTLNKTPPPPEPVAVTPPPPPPAATTEAPPPPPPAAPRSKVPAFVTLGFAGAGAIVGTIFGVMALGAKSDFDAKPTTENADRADRNALIADMSFAVAITFGVTGAVLLFSKDTTEEPKAAGAPPKTAPRRAFITPYVGPTGGGAAAKLTF
jgi:hypothetical protein